MTTEIIKKAVSKFLNWPIPKDFCPDGGVVFDGRVDDALNKNKTWPTGTNLFSADQATEMFEHCLGETVEPLVDLEKISDDPIARGAYSIFIASGGNIDIGTARAHLEDTIKAMNDLSKLDQQFPASGPVSPEVTEPLLEENPLNSAPTGLG